MAAFVGLSAAFGQTSTVAQNTPITPKTLLRVASSFATPLRPLLSALDGAEAISTGSDGRLTVLLIGSDACFRAT